MLHSQRFELPAEDPLPREYDVVACPGCGFVFADTPAPQATYDAYYTGRSKYEDRHVGTGGGDDPYDRARLEGTAAFLAEAVTWRDRPTLDLGCATGGLLRALQREGFTDLSGVDPSPACAAAVRAMGFRGHAGGLFAPPAQGAFALVCLSHVLEHVRDLGPAAAALRELLDEQGLLYVEVPDAAGYAAHMRAPFQDLNTEHINHFDRASLQRLLVGAGFTPIAVGEKVFEAGRGTPIPAVFALARRSDGPEAPRGYDGRATAAVREYVARSSDELRRIDALIAPHASGPIQVWGVGQLLFKLLADTSLGRAQVVAWLDNNPKLQGSTLRGVPVRRPADAEPGVPILIASTLHGPAIARAARALGLDNPLIQLGADPSG